MTASQLPHDAVRTDDQLRQHDAAARARALEIRSFIVEAPAGAGKTELLTQRYLRLLATVTEPEAIIAITFTNKAAAEMRNRILGNLQTAANEVLPDKPHQKITYGLARAALACDEKYQWRILQQPSRLRVMTIDSLCGMLARQMPFLTRFGSQPAISDDPDALYEEAANRTVEKLEAAGTPDSLIVQQALAHLDNDAPKLVGLITEMLSRRDQWRRYLEDGRLSVDSDVVAAAIQAIVVEELVRAHTTIDDAMQNELMPLAAYALAHVSGNAAFAALDGWEEPLTPGLDDLPRWRALAVFLMTDGKWRSPKGINAKHGFPADDKTGDQRSRMMALLSGFGERPEQAAALWRVMSLPACDRHDEEFLLVRVFIALLQMADAELQAVFRERKTCDFIEVSARAIEALGDEDGPSDMALRLDYAVRHLLVDEFQDTSPTQIDLLTRLTEGWQAGDDRTLFCVGDPMQSIYRFRKAEVGLFLEAKKAGIGHIALEPLRLSLNNRSAAEVIEWVNRDLAQIFPPADQPIRGDITYRSFVTNHAPMSEAGVTIHPVVVAGKPTGAEANAREVETILQIIDQTRAGGRDRKIAVLVRGRGHLEPLVAESRRSLPDLRFQAVEGERLSSRQWIADAVILTRALLQLADRVNWLALLRAPWCGLTLSDLHALAGFDRESTLWELINQPERLAAMSEDGQRRLLAVRTSLQEVFAHRGHQSLSRWIQGAWLLLNGPATLPDAAAANDIDAYFSLVERLDTAGGFELDRLEAELEDLYSAPDPQASGDLFFMTIHKSKGLEFDTVILPGLHRKTGGDDEAMLIWDEIATAEGSTQLVVAPYLPKRLNKDEASVYTFLKELESTRGQNEVLRVLYVAATRAIRHLHWVGVATVDKSGKVKPPGSTALALLWPIVGGRFEGVGDGGPISQGAEFPSYERICARSAPARLRIHRGFPEHGRRAGRGNFLTGHGRRYSRLRVARCHRGNDHP